MVPIAGRRATARPARAESRCLSMTGGFGSPAAACSIAFLKVIRERRTVDIGAGSTTREGSSLIAHSCLQRWHLHRKTVEAPIVCRRGCGANHSRFSCRGSRRDYFASGGERDATIGSVQKANAPSGLKAFERACAQIPPSSRGKWGAQQFRGIGQAEVPAREEG